MIRLGIGLHDEQHAFAEKESRRRKVSLAQIVREIFSLGLEAYKKQTRR